MISDALSLYPRVSACLYRYYSKRYIYIYIRQSVLRVGVHAIVTVSVDCYSITSIRSGGYGNEVINDNVLHSFNPRLMNCPTLKVMVMACFGDKYELFGDWLLLEQASGIFWVPRLARNRDDRWRLHGKA